MVRSSHKTKILFVVATILMAPAIVLSSARAANPENVNLQVNIAEALTLTITDPTTWASGGLVNTNPTTGKPESAFLRNKVNVSAKSNSPIGITVSMYTKNDTDLRNTTTGVYSSSDASTYIPTLTSDTGAIGAAGANFPTNYWGYSQAHSNPVTGATDGTHDDDTLKSTAIYKPLSTTAIQLFTTVPSSGGTSYVGTDVNEDIYFGAKADYTKQSGTYARTVYFAAVTGTIDTDNPLIPVNPSEPDPINDVAHYSSTPTNQTSATYRSTSGSGVDPVTGSMDSTETKVTAGDVTSTYAKAYGVTSSSNTGSALATAFAVAAGVSAVSGFAFFIAAKRKKDDDDEEEGS